MQHKKSFVISVAMILCLNLFSDSFRLIENGAPAAVMVVPANNCLAESMKLFNDAIRRCTGTTLPVATAPDKLKNTIVFRLEKQPFAFDDKFTLSFPNPRTLLVTGTERSTAAAICYILEEHFQCRFLFPVRIDLPYDESINHYPFRKNVSMPICRIEKSAAFNLARAVDWQIRAWDSHWNIKPELVTNSHMIPIDIFPVYKYAVDQSWPQEIMPTWKGKKYLPPKAKAPLSKNIYLASQGYNAGWNPCFTHPKTTDIAIANILELMQREPERTSICMSINDNGGMCECDTCLKSIGGTNQVGRRNYSPVYWKWVNDVAKVITKKYPDLYITALAYREVLEPPHFKLNKNIVPQICFELTAMDDPEMAEKRKKLLKAWSEKAGQLSFWDYSYGLSHYLFPRIYFKSHSEKLALLHAFKVRGIFVESSALLPFEGPKHYLMAKKLQDLNMDTEKTIMDWCNATVGPESAPYLREYYRFWENYWNSADIKKTAWYNSRVSTYMQLGELPSHTYALKKGDMRKLRKLMEQVDAKTQTTEQKKRAEVLMQLFEFSELAATALFSELFQPSGKLAQASDAVLLLEAVPVALKAHKKLLENPYAKYYSALKSIGAAQLSAIGSILPFLDDPAVKKALLNLASHPETPVLLKSQLKIWLGTEPENLIPNGSFEAPVPMPIQLWNDGKAHRSGERASDGKFAFHILNGTYAIDIPVQQGKTYLFLFDAFIGNTSIEGVLNYQLTPRIGETNIQHVNYLNNRLTGGKWMTFSGICKPEKVIWTKGTPDNIRFMIWLRKFEKEDEIYIDNIRAFCLDDMK